MKTQTILLLFFIFASCSQKASLQGKIAGLTNDTIYVIYGRPDIKSDAEASVDTVIAPDGKFSVNLPQDTLLRVLIIPEELILRFKGRSAYPDDACFSFYYFPGNKLKIKGAIDGQSLKGIVTGSAYTEQWSDFRNTTLFELEKQQMRLQKEISMERFAPDNMTEKEISEKNDSVELLFVKQRSLKRAYILEYPDHELSAFYLKNAPLDSIPYYAGLLSQRVKNGYMSPIVKQQMDVYEREQKRAAANRMIREDGAEAPDFILPSINGAQVQLSSLRGRYVVLDFWGMWCGWCIKGIPEMKKYYDTYKSAVEFVSIDCYDREDKWKAGVAEQHMNWVNVIDDEKNPVVLKYGVVSFPTKIVIDPQGKVAGYFEGESPEFYAFLDSLFGHKK